MAKDIKQQATRPKDYAEDVLFPVKIIGKDGLVRRYDFESAVCLYERRIHAASRRFTDPKLIDVEVSHCRSRIYQFRRSYFHCHGWHRDGDSQAPDSVDIGLAGEVTALLQRVYRVTGRLHVTFHEVLQGPRHFSWLVEPAVGPKLLLDAHHQHSPADQAPGDFPPIAIDVYAQGQGDRLRLVAEKTTEAWSLHLSGRGADVTILAAGIPLPVEQGRTNGARLWMMAETRIGRREYADGLAYCRSILARYRWHRDASIMTASLALYFDQVSEAESIAWVASHHFPDDPEVLLVLARARMARGALSSTTQLLDRALVQSPTLGKARVLRAVLALRRFEWRVFARQIFGPTGFGPTIASVQQARMRVLGTLVVAICAVVLLGVAASWLSGWSTTLAALGLIGMGAWQYFRVLPRHLLNIACDEPHELFARIK